MAEVDEGIDKVPGVDGKLVGIRAAIQKAVVSIAALEVVAHEQLRPWRGFHLPQQRIRLAIDGSVSFNSRDPD